MFTSNLQILIFLLLMFLSKMVHTKCRACVYPLSEVKRLLIPDDKVPWSVSFDDYNPPEYNSDSIFNKPWSDPPTDNKTFNPKWNELDGNVNRKSHNGSYNVVNGRPLNPQGRTGLAGRGRLGRWGPNHAADPVVTRWKIVNGEKVLNAETKLPVLQFCAVQRRDNGQWALPGGMVDPGEQVSQTLMREFMEEALNSLESSPDQKDKNTQLIEAFFKNGQEIYRGYVDDPRNTDNAWMETVAVNFHDEKGETVGKINLTAGDDAKNVSWMDIDKSKNLYADHAKFVKSVTDLHKAHW